MTKGKGHYLERRAAGISPVDRLIAVRSERKSRFPIHLCEACHESRDCWVRHLPRTSLPWPGGQAGAASQAARMFLPPDPLSCVLTTEERAAEWDLKNLEQIEQVEDICLRVHGDRPRRTP